jgi:hypothetical protein
LDWQTPARGSFDPQRFSGALANHHRRCRTPKDKTVGRRKCRSLAKTRQNQIYVVPQNQAKTMNANTEPNTAPKVINGRINGRFAPGYSGNPGGSPDRARKALNAETIAELHRAFRIGGRQAINKVMRNQPAVFLKLLVLLVPREMKVEHSRGVKEMTDEQLKREIELVKEMLAQREAGANAKVIEGEATPSLPAPTAVNAKSL